MDGDKKHEEELCLTGYNIIWSYYKKYHLADLKDKDVYNKF